MRDQVAMHEKNYENQTSKGTAAHISHIDLTQKQNLSQKQLMNEKRSLEKQLHDKNKEIEALNLRIEKQTAYHQREVKKLEEDLNSLKDLHQDWVERVQKENEDWNQ